MQQELVFSVAPLGGGLSGQGAAVVFKIQLADHHRPIRAVLLQQREKLIAGADIRARQALEILHAAQNLQHLLGRPPAAIAIAKEHKAVARTVVVLVVAGALAHLRSRDHAVVAVGRWKVSQHLAAINALPCEGVVLRLIELIPGKLLRQEAADARLPHDLGQLAVVAEDVGVPELTATPTELLLEETLPLQELPNERLAGRNVAVRLHPGPPHRKELPRLRLLP